jgi:hypothetical protein
MQVVIVVVDSVVVILIVQRIPRGPAAACDMRAPATVMSTKKMPMRRQGAYIGTCHAQTLTSWRAAAAAAMWPPPTAKYRPLGAGRSALDTMELVRFCARLLPCPSMWSFLAESLEASSRVLHRGYWWPLKGLLLMRLCRHHVQGILDSRRVHACSACNVHS